MKDMRNNPIENGNLCFRSRMVNGETLMRYALVISNKLFWIDDKLNSKQLIVIEHLNDDEKKMRKEWLKFMATTKSKKVKDADRVIVKDLLSEI